MKKLAAALAALTCALILSSCSSANESGGPSCDAHCQSNIDAGCADQCASDEPGTSAGAEPSVVVDNYDTATCADWLVTDKLNRRIVSTYFLVRANDSSIKGLELALRTAITTACGHVDPAVTVKRVAELSIKTLQGAN